MPIRFQVDPDFYDHPKTLDLSDAAVALWTRAGSYSVAKLLDGFVPEAKLAQLSKTPDEASQELVRRGLWRRVRGGFQYHQWELRNPLTRARIEADRDYERDKKRRQRQAARQDAGTEKQQSSNGHVPTGVPAGHFRDMAGTPGGFPAASDSDSVSDSVLGASRARASGTVYRGTAQPVDNFGSNHPPSPKCEQHTHHPNPPPCGPCADARRAFETWQADRRARIDSAPKCATHAGELADNCRACAADRKVAAARFGAPPNERQA